MKPCDLIVMVIAIRLKELTTCSLVKRGNEINYTKAKLRHVIMLLTSGSQ